MKRTARFLFHVSGTGFLLSVALWFVILYLQSVRGYDPLRAPLEPRIPIRILAGTVLGSTAASVLGGLLGFLGWLRHRIRLRSRHA